MIAISVLPSAAISHAGGECDINDDGNVDLGDLIVFQRQILGIGIDNDGDGYVVGCDCDDGNANSYPSAAELCDGLDNNCDGQVDEALVIACGSNVGVCQQGTQTCVNGQYGTCVGEVGPTAELCDGLDNNCDGQVDEGCP
jgi:hypothetical protein